MGGGGNTAATLFVLGSSLAEGLANQQALNANAAILDQNARLARIQGRAEIRRGREAANRVRIAARKTIGAQRASLAAQGVVVDVGTAALFVEDTERQAEGAAIALQNEAALRAFGLRVEAQSTEFRAGLTRARAGREPFQTLLGGVDTAFRAGFISTSGGG